jgi:hypothetical protein
VALIAGLATQSWFIAALGAFLILLGARMWVRQQGNEKATP